MSARVRVLLLAALVLLWSCAEGPVSPRTTDVSAARNDAAGNLASNGNGAVNGNAYGHANGSGPATGNGQSKGAGAANSDLADDSGEPAPNLPDLAPIARFKVKSVPPDPLIGTGMIGPEGGSLRVGDFEIIVPPGAVSTKVNFRIKRPVDPNQAEFAFAEFSPHITFNVPVTIRLPDARTDADEDASVLWWSGSGWIALPTVTTSDGRIETQVWHFSYYGTSRYAKGITTVGG